MGSGQSFPQAYDSGQDFLRGLLMLQKGLSSGVKLSNILHIYRAFYFRVHSLVGL